MLPLLDFDLGNLYLHLRSDMDYSIAVLVLMLFIKIYISFKHYIPTAHNRAFTVMLNCVICAMMLEITSNLLLSYYEIVPLPINKIFVVLNLFARLNVVMAFLRYTFTNMKLYATISGWRWYLIALIPSVACLLILLSAIINSPKMVFWFDADRCYHEGTLFILMRASLFLILFVSYIPAIVLRKRIPKTSFVTTTIFLAFVFCQVPIEAVLPIIYHPYMITYVGCSLGGLIMFLSFQNPDGYIDQVTGLFNREGFINTMEDMYEYNKSFGLCVFDLLDYEAMIEMYGSETENEFRRSLSNYINELYGAGRTFLIGESRIAVLLKNTKELQKAAFRIATTQNYAVLVNGEEMQVNFVGTVISCPENAENLAKLEDIINYALEYAKQSYFEGGTDSTGKLVIVNDKILRMNQRENNVKDTVNDSINKDELYVFYQPIFDLSTHKIIAAEAVCRLYNLDIGWIPTNEFIKLSEKSGQVIYIGQQVLSKVCRFIKSINMYDLGLDFISVNMSPEQCIQANLASDIMKTIENYRVPTDKINFETSEPMQPKLAENMSKLIKELKTKGIGFTLDDYGAGYSNITNTLRLPFDIIKISKEIHQLYFDGKSDVLPVLIKTIKNLGYKVAIGDIDTEEQAKIIEELGCDYAQGDYYAKVMNAYDFKECVEKINGVAK